MSAILLRSACVCAAGGAGSLWLASASALAGLSSVAVLDSLSESWALHSAARLRHAAQICSVAVLSGLEDLSESYV